VGGKKETARLYEARRVRGWRKVMSDKAKSSRSRISAGLLMFRRTNDDLEVLLAHPGGPFFARKDDGVWTIPKGEAAPGEDLLTRAQIEFEEEVGCRPENLQPWIELGWIKQKGGKIVHAWAFEGDLPEPFECKSNMFEIEWPPRSGKRKMFPEVDKARFFSEKKARRKLKPTQVPFLDRLRAALG
jgi:predicted NUDIX family NTP pyrophosphohydrolase